MLSPHLSLPIQYGTFPGIMDTTITPDIHPSLISLLIFKDIGISRNLLGESKKAAHLMYADMFLTEAAENVDFIHVPLEIAGQDIQIFLGDCETAVAQDFLQRYD